MPRADARWSGWGGVLLVAVTYIYFLIFAQFAFLKRLATLGIADVHLKTVMAAMAIGGIALSLLAPRLSLWSSPRLRLRVALSACAASALVTLLPLGFAGSLIVSLLIGASLGLLTVTVATYLRSWLGNRNPLLKVGLGTGIGYLICNFPPLFNASAQLQAITAAMFCLAGVFVSLKQAGPPAEETAAAPESTVSLLRVLTCFTALVWLDSAAFYIIQNTSALKAGTWESTFNLWAIGLLHLLAALSSVWFLRRRSLPLLLSLAYVALAIACLLLLTFGGIRLAFVFYPIGVSLYSVALVAYPSLLAPASSAAERGRKAGWVYAVAGWFGSAMGIGMSQQLGHVPPAFVLFSGAVILVPELLGFLRRRKCELAVAVAILVAALCIQRASRVASAGLPVAPALRTCHDGLKHRHGETLSSRAFCFPGSRSYLAGIALAGVADEAASNFKASAAAAADEAGFCPVTRFPSTCTKELQSAPFA
jgi:cytochrome c oxidase cbb3-type subunit 2